MSCFNLAMLGGAAARPSRWSSTSSAAAGSAWYTWGAMHLLESVVRVNRRRMKLEHLLVAAGAVSIPVLLALCMAGPLIPRWQSPSSKAPTSAVLLVDNSYSMDAGRAGDTALNAAGNEAAQDRGRTAARIGLQRDRHRRAGDAALAPRHQRSRRGDPAIRSCRAGMVRRGSRRGWNWRPPTWPKWNIPSGNSS